MTTTDRVLSPTDPTQSGDQMVLYLTRDEDSWNDAQGREMLAVNSTRAATIRYHPSTVVTRPAPAERDWQQGDAVHDNNGFLWERLHPALDRPWRNAAIGDRADARMCRPLHHLTRSTDNATVITRATDNATVITSPTPVEREWLPGDMVLDSRSPSRPRFFTRTDRPFAGLAWRDDLGRLYRDHVLIRPLQRIVHATDTTS